MESSTSMFGSFTLNMKHLDNNSTFVFVNKTAESASLSRSKGDEKALIDSHVRKRTAQKRKPLHVLSPTGYRGTVKPLSAARGQHRNSRHHSCKLAAPKQKSQARLSSSISCACSCTDDNELAEVSATLFQIAAPLPKYLAEMASQTDAQRSLAFFRQRTLLEATGWVDNHFWNRVVLPLSHAHPAMFFALASLGSIHESLTSTNKNAKQVARIKSLELCNQAIQLAVSKNNDLPLTVLLPICFVFTTIQMFECMGTAHANLRHGLGLINSARKQEGRSLSHTEIDVLNTVEDLFERYQCRLTLIMGSVNRKQSFLSSQEEGPPSIPAKFKDLLEARNCLEKLNTWSYQQACDSGSHPEKLPKLLKPYHDNWLRAMSAVPDAVAGLTDQISAMRSTNLLKAARIASFILICTMHSDQQTAYDHYTDHFRDIVKLYEPLINCMREASWYQFTFGYDAGMIETLSLAGTSCRDSKIRQRAIDLLQKSSRFEGVVSSRVAAMIGTQWKAIEEEGLSAAVVTPDMIPEQRRVRLESLDEFPSVGLARLRFIRAPYILGPSAELVERWFSYNLPGTGNLNCYPEKVEKARSLGVSTTKTKTGDEELLPWPESFRMMDSRIFFPIPRV